MDRAPDEAQARLVLLRQVHAGIALDTLLGDGSGVEILRAFRAAGGTAPALFLTADGTAQDVRERRGIRAQDQLVPPVEIPMLIQRVRRPVSRKPVRTEQEADPPSAAKTAAEA